MATGLSVFERVRTTITRHTSVGDKPDAVTPQSKLGADLNMDSLDVMELELALEDEFKIDLSEMNIPSLTDTVLVVSDAIEGALANG
jgi:acyl carrier protein